MFLMPQGRYEQITANTGSHTPQKDGREGGIGLAGQKAPATQAYCLQRAAALDFWLLKVCEAHAATVFWL